MTDIKQNKESNCFKTGTTISRSALKTQYLSGCSVKLISTATGSSGILHNRLFCHTRTSIQCTSRVIFSWQQRQLFVLTPPDNTCGFTPANPRCSPPVIPHFFKFALVCFLLSSSSSSPLPYTSLWMPHPPSPTLDSCPPDPLAGATPPIGRLSRCVHPLSLTTTSRARRATWRTPSRALHALHPLIRGTARTGTPLPLPSMPLYTS